MEGSHVPQTVLSIQPELVQHADATGRLTRYAHQRFTSFFFLSLPVLFLSFLLLTLIRVPPIPRVSTTASKHILPHTAMREYHGFSYP